MSKNPITFILLDESVLVFGLRVLVEGVELTQFRRNPVMLGLHDDEWLPIGRWVNIRIENKQILADAEFDYEDPDKRVQRLIGKVERGFIKMASSGLVEMIFSDDPALKIEGQEFSTVIKCRMREASIVPIGGNHNAFRLLDEHNAPINLEDKAAVLQLMDKSTQIFIQMNELNKILNLADNADEAARMAAVNLLLADKRRLEGDNSRIKKENDTLISRIDAIDIAEKKAKTDKAIALTDAAVLDGRLNADGKMSVLELFDLDFAKAEKMLNNLPKRKSITGRIDSETQIDNVELADFTKKEWAEIDKENKLTLLHDKYPELYKEKFKKRFGTEPKM
ncbi:MAG: hypothetical protein JXR34_12135 [Bacteroidales bacterium]|nr:hypothetical protein [Bacteroidales bacterium]